MTEVHNFFCNTTERDGCAHSTFEDLPVTYSLPLKIVTRNWGENSGPPATETTEQQNNRTTEQQNNRTTV
ncbi:MAG: hypothetical protein OXD32_06425 [Endozoicomonadaceae bacterium]|nr:hypothetical protein [Endozoicomonadaceae bacterium]